MNLRQVLEDDGGRNAGQQAVHTHVHTHTHTPHRRNVKGTQGSRAQQSPAFIDSQFRSKVKTHASQ